MDTSKLKKFAQFARRRLMEEVAAKLKLVLDADSLARRENGEAVLKLEEQIKDCGQAWLVERVAYTWFNRFCALRFMDVNRYTRIGVVSPAEGQFQPEILAEAKMGHIDEEMVPQPLRKKIFALLDGSAPSPDAQTEAYRLLVVAACDGYYRAMPYLFERIDDYTELLMPDDLLSGNSILAYTREAMTPDACEDVEVLGWLYQFYISEKKDEVFTDLKKKKKITPENIPAATQLFTPHWIVRYLVENSLGRLWLLNRPKSRLIEQMEYYIQPEQAETDFLRINKPEEIKICDPACGSGHMLVYAFDLLYAIYEEEGYEQPEIPEKILTYNLYGIEIDERAGTLAAFALTMKARAKQRRFFRKPIQPNICILESIQFADGELKDYMDFIGRNLFTVPLLETLHQFREADNLGSLIRPVVADVRDVLRLLEEKDIGGQLLLYQIHQKVLKVLQQADYLSPKYHIVIANPPYMGGSGMNEQLGDWAKKNYPDSKTDLFAMFIERNLDLSVKKGLVAMITMQSWMFLSSFERLRQALLNNQDILALIQIGYNSFPELNSKVAQACAFVLNNYPSEVLGSYLNLNDAPQAADKEKVFLSSKKTKIFRVRKQDFRKIPGSPIAYWVSEKVRKIFEESDSLGSVGSPTHGIVTGDNERFLKNWHEVSHHNICFTATNREESVKSGVRWFPVSKGGSFRRWFGNQEFVIDWFNDGYELRTTKHHTGRIRATNFNLDRIFKPGITWSTITSSSLSMRYLPEGMIFESKGSVCFSDTEEQRLFLLALTNTHVINKLLLIMSPTLDYHEGPLSRLPIVTLQTSQPSEIAQKCRGLSEEDWNSYETSWDFAKFPLLIVNHYQTKLIDAYSELRKHWLEMTQIMKQLEEENNRIFIDAYGLQDELTPEVSLNEITLTCNPYYRYGSDKTEEELEALLLADTMREFISYAVGCMFGRFSLNKPGLILANQGETIEDYLQQIPNPTFPADADNVIPMLDGDWFPDDISERFRKFLRVTFGEEHYTENLKFLEKAIGKDIRRYFLRDFYNDHIRRYKKRPIYWLFSSPKGTFNALIYMHRYRPDTVSVVLNDYLREFRTKLVSHRSHLEAVSISTAASAAEKTKALKEIESLRKAIDELESYEREVLYPLATERVEINLDDGVRINYGKFGAALKKIPGLEAVED
ncbi:BREX-1 system adenine-specific DNA-methyltransferase PglX [Leptolyngbya sp. FACHB-541]|uniref:BREX-1 system adenine-specific DNA-methyltransferase PglX n=1 Tax=Leptolyngbya sp. FACHB-541 TaxID=2692810 RepID=UPI001684C310|nr:BREX-1 system adenine-specific DNA-methyltransferase PglX [Leptolyngbya sp. FACHB-541]MBD1998029.1 BREX-1 system adenine-specific DNA-methyltransferase PglX [Leptolyngbya sp. FACHB-541]